MKIRRGHARGVIAERAKRCLIYGGIFFLLAMVQCSFLARINILPATPSLVIGAVALVALIDDSETAYISAITGGIIIDAVGGMGMYLSPVLCLLVAAFVSLMARKMLTSFLSYAVLLPLAALLRGGFTCLESFLYFGSIAWKPFLLGTLLPEVILTVIFALPLYPMIYFAIRPLLERSSVMKGNV